MDCIVAMPSQLFYTTQIPFPSGFCPGAKSSRADPFHRRRKMGTMVTRKLRELSESDIQKIAGTYQAFAAGTLEDVKGFCAVASTEEIARQDYILTPGALCGHRGTGRRRRAL